MININCIIIDDEPMALNLLKTYVEKTAYLKLQGTFSNAIEALDFIKENPIHLIFSDIQMPELNGIQFASAISKETKIIFTTAFDEYAIDGFKHNAIDYLLKPFNYEEFLTASNKALEWFNLLWSQSTSNSEIEFLFVKSEYKQIKIDLSNILYIEGLKDYVKIWLNSEPRPVITLMSLKKLEEDLPSSFMRIHRSYIVSLDKIDLIERSKVVINNNYINISDQYKETFLEFIKNNSM